MNSILDHPPTSRLDRPSTPHRMVGPPRPHHLRRRPSPLPPWTSRLAATQPSFRSVPCHRAVSITMMRGHPRRTSPAQALTRRPERFRHHIPHPHGRQGRRNLQIPQPPSRCRVLHARTRPSGPPHRHLGGVTTPTRFAPVILCRRARFRPGAVGAESFSGQRSGL